MFSIAGRSIVSTRARFQRSGGMQRSRTIHIVPQATGIWEVRLDGHRSVLQFTDLGHAIDAATAVTVRGATTRVIVHQPQTLG